MTSADDLQPTARNVNVRSFPTCSFHVGSDSNSTLRLALRVQWATLSLRQLGSENGGGKWWLLFDACKSTRERIEQLKCKNAGVVCGLQRLDLVLFSWTNKGFCTSLLCFKDFLFIFAQQWCRDLYLGQEESYAPFASFSFDGVLGLALDSMAQATNESVCGYFWACFSIGWCVKIWFGLF